MQAIANKNSPRQMRGQLATGELSKISMMEKKKHRVCDNAPDQEHDDKITAEGPNVFGNIDERFANVDMHVHILPRSLLTCYRKRPCCLRRGKCG